MKNNGRFFPRDVLTKILRAQYGNRVAGHWVVMKAVISDVPIIGVVYTWSNHGLSFFVSSCGSTLAHDEKYMSNFEDEYGNAASNLLDRPSIA